MESTVRKTRPVRPVAKCWNLAKDLDYSEKLELMSMLIESVKPVAAKSYTVEEMNDMLDQAEADIAAGRVIDDDDMWLDMDEEYERELAEEQKRQLEIV